MKWFKHLSDLPRDEGVARYLDEAGKDRVVAYGFLMFLLEAIALRMDSKVGHLVCSVTYSISQWGHITYSHANRVRKYLRMCEDIGWVQVKFEGSSCTVTIPKMVEWRDETTRKSGVPPEQLAQIRGDKIRQDKRENTQDGTLSDCLTAGDSRLSPPPDFKVKENLRKWAADNYPSVVIDKETDKFLRHDFPTPHTNWDNAWKNWIQRGYEYQQKHNGSCVKPSRKEDLLKLGKDLRLERKLDESEDQYFDRIERANDKRIANL